MLMDGRAHTGGELARFVGVSPSTVSEHLSKLLDAAMVTVEAQGRHRYYRLAGPEVAELLEAPGATTTPVIAPVRPVPAMLSYARTCYDHLAGEVAVRIYDRLLANGHLSNDDNHLRLTGTGIELLAVIGVDIDSVTSGKRPQARSCLDWTERRHHLAGASGAGLLSALVTNSWAAHGAEPRAIRVTATGRAALSEHFGLDGTT